MQIQSLLNPTGSDPSEPYSHTSPSLSLAAKSSGPVSFHPAQQSILMPPSLVCGRRAQLDINYDHHAILSNPGVTVPPSQLELARKHKEFKLSLRDAKIGSIRENTRSVPYASAKKPFLAEIGRSALEVFEYEFRLGDRADRVYHVMWDYNNGLTRITPFFKACNHNKVVPVKALSATPPLLNDLSLSITGGSIIAQGYWIPFECARALCKTFCYNIRWALTPIFGPDFINQCLRPGQAGYEQWKIDEGIVQGDQDFFATLREHAAENKNRTSKAPHTVKTKVKVPTARSPATASGKSSSPSGAGAGQPAAKILKLKLKRSQTQESSPSSSANGIEYMSEQQRRLQELERTRNDRISFEPQILRTYIRYGDREVYESPPVSPKTIPINHLDAATLLSDGISGGLRRHVVQQETDYHGQNTTETKMTHKRKKEVSLSTGDLSSYSAGGSSYSDDTSGNSEYIVRSPSSSPPVKKKKKVRKPAGKAIVSRTILSNEKITAQECFNELDAANALVAMQHNPRASFKRADTI